MASYKSWEMSNPQFPLLPPKSLGVFWDIENCSVPSGKSPMAVCHKIRNLHFFSGHREVQFTVVCDANKESKTVLEELDKAQVDIIHVPSNRKNAADDKLKQMMRRFADLHRDGSRIVLISGDMDFAADIADFKRRMFLSVILLHNSNASESLLLAASEVYNFHEILSTIPVKHDNNVILPNDEITVSNLPSVRDWPEEKTLQKLKEIAKPFGGKVTKIYGSNGSANLKFVTADQAKAFKSRCLHYKIQDRPINIHFSYKSGKSLLPRSRGKSFSQSPGRAPRIRNRALSESGRKGQTSSEEYQPRRCSSQDSLLSDANVDEKVDKQVPRFLDVSDSFNKMALSKKKSHGVHVPPKQRRISDSSLGQSSGEDEPKNKRIAKKTHSKIKSKLKLKNRKKSEATPQFLNKHRNANTQDDDSDQEIVADKDQSNLKKDNLSQISTNLYLLIDTQLVRLDLIDHLYKERYQADLIDILSDNGVQSLPNFIQEFCMDLTTVNFNMVPHIVLRKGEFVQNYLARVNDVLYNLQKGNDYCPVPVPIFEHEYRETHGIGAFLDLDFVTRECSGIRKTSRAFDREFLELTLLFMLGNEIVEVLSKRGGVLLLSNFIGTYKAVTGKNLDPTNFGFDNLENLIKKLDLFIKPTGNKKSIVLSSIHKQLYQRENQNRQRFERENESEYATADENNVIEGASTNAQAHNTKPDIIGETKYDQELDNALLNRSPRQEDINQQSSSSRMDSLARGLHPTVSPALKSLRQEQMFKSRKLKLTSFVNTKTQTWQGRREDDKYSMETRNEQGTVPSEDIKERNAEIVYSANTPGDIVTIEESMSEAESMASDVNYSVQSGVPSTRGRGRRKSRLAANFSGSEH